MQVKIFTTIASSGLILVSIPRIGRKLPDRVYSASDILEAVNNWSLDTVELKHTQILDREYNGV
jgi:hypothetical protein